MGMAGRFPQAADINEFWSHLCAGRECLSRLSDAELRATGVPQKMLNDSRYVPVNGVLADVELFDADFFRINPREASITDPQHRLFLELAWQALENSGYDAAAYQGAIGVYAGCGLSSYLLHNLWPNRAELSDAGELRVRMANSQEYLATRVSFKLDLRGPSVSINTACSTSLVALHLACDALLNFQCNMALSGGISIQLPQGQGYLYEEGGILSPDGHCRAFDADAQGTVSGNGGAVVVLKRLADALADGDTVYAIIRGSAINNDGADKAGYTAPSVNGQARVIAEAQAVAGVDAEAIGYIETHGTGTPLGDPIEFAALTQVFRRQTARRQFCAIGSVKTNVGHLDEAAGVAGLIKTVLSLYHRQLPPSLHFKRPNPNVELESSPFYVNDRAREWVTEGPRFAGVSSFGIGGTNAHVVLEEAPPPPALPSLREEQLLTLSARTRRALEAASRNLADHLELHPEVSLADVAFTLAVGRRAFAERRTLVCRTHAEAISQLRSGTAEVGAARSSGQSVILLFPGQGSQHAGMAAELYRTESAFREAIDECAGILERRCGFDLSGALFPDDDCGVSRIDETITAQPTLFATEYALAILLQSWGIEPEAMIGHSLGEYVAATLADVFPLEDALALIVARGRLMQSTAPGAMIAVPMSETECAPLLERGLSIAALNAPSLTVLSGPAETIALVESDLAARGITPIQLRTSRAFHSTTMDPILEPFRGLLKKTSLRAPAKRFISNLTGDWITPAQATDPEYWLRHLREPVLFSQGVARLLELSDAVWLEAGPGRALASLIERHPGAPRVLQTLPSARSKSDQSAPVLKTLGQLWSNGLAVDWNGFFKGEQRRRVPLPTYPFERQRYWIDDPASHPQPAVAPVERSTDSSPIESWFYTPQWTPSMAISEHKLAGGSWAIFGGETGLVGEVTSRLRKAGARVAVARLGDVYGQSQSGEFDLPLDDPSAHSRLWRDLDEPAWSEANLLLFAPGSGAPPHAGVLNLLALVQGIGSSTAARKLVAVTHNAQAVLGGEVSRPENGLLCGAIGVVAEEYPNLRCCAIDLDDRNSEQEAAAGILTGLSLDGANLAVREGLIWEQRIEPAPLAETETLRVCERGAYLITGGLGSMGLAFAEHLARTSRARLALISRTGLAHESYAETTSAAAGAERKAAIRRRIRQIEEAGAEVYVIAADISNADDAARAVLAAETRFGPVKGVIHAAGLLGQTLIRQQTPAEVRRVLAPKVEGALHLASALEGRSLDFFILCSSMSSIVPIPGQFAYSAANAFLDSFARFRAARCGGLTVSIDWGFWQELGMIETANVSEAAKRRARDEIESKGWSNYGVEIFARILQSGAPAQLIVSPREPGLLMAEKAAEAEQLDHPILHDYAMENARCAVFSGTISESKTWLVKEHRVGGQAVLPATAYLDLVVTAFWRRHGRRPVELTDVCFLAPMTFAEQQNRQVRLILEDNSGDSTFRVLSQLPSQTWQEHARGEIRGCPPELRRERTDFEKVKRRLEGESNGRSHLPAGFWERVRRFEPHWRNVADAVFGSSEGVARFELAAELASDLSQFALHPALLDTATGFMAFRDEFDAFVPFSFRRVCVFDRLPASCASAFRFVGDSPVFYGSVADALGNEIVRVEAYTLRRIHNGGSAARLVHHELEEDAESLRAAAAPSTGLRWEEILRRRPPAVALDEREPAPAAASAAELRGNERPRLRTDFRAPESASEKAIAGVWENLLGVAPIGRDDDFFELKGDSLLAAQVMSRLRQLLGVKLPLSLIFDFPTARLLAAQIDSRQTPRELLEQPAAQLDESAAGARIQPAPPQADYPITHAQKRLWILSQNPTALVAYNMSYSLSLRGLLNLTALRQTFELIVERHESLRTAFMTTGGEPRQQVRPPQSFRLPLLDLCNENDPAGAAEREIRAEALAPFHLDRPPLLRARLLRLAEDEHVLLISLHHIIADGLTLNVLMRELHTCYAALCAGRSPELAPLAIQYKDYAVWQQQELGGEAMRTHRAYWLEKLGGELPTLALPIDRPRPPLQEFSGGQVIRWVPPPLREALHRRCQKQGVTLFMLLVTAVKVLLHQITGQADILIGCPVAGRELAELEGQVGFYLNTVVLRDTIRRNEAFTALLQRVRHTFTEAIAHQDYPFDLLVEELAVAPSPGHSPLFDVQINLMPSDTPPPQLGDLAVAGSVTNSQTTLFDLNFMFSESPLGLAIEIGYSTALFDASTIERLGDRLLQLLTAINEQPESTVRSLCQLLEENPGTVGRAEFLASTLNLDEEF